MFVKRKNKVFIHTHKRVKPAIIIAANILLFCCFFLTGHSADHLRRINALMGVREEGFATIMAPALPGYTVSGSNKVEFETLTRRFLFAVTGLDVQNLQGILSNELNWTAARAAIAPHTALAAAVELNNGEEDFYLPGQDEALDDWNSVTEDEFGPVQLNGEPMVLIYTTHNAETYKPSDGQSKLEGKNAGVAEVAKTLSLAIESRYSIKTLYSDVIHDYPDFTKSYINSMRTVTSLLQKNTKIQLVLDVHRDAGLEKRADTLVQIGKKSYAKVLIILGKEHPKWQENLAFARKIEAKANELYPGLIKGVRLLEDRRYNQHLHPRSLLLEFGSDLNTREDAKNSAVLMAEVIAKVLIK